MDQLPLAQLSWKFYNEYVSAVSGETDNFVTWLLAALFHSRHIWRSSKNCIAPTEYRETSLRRLAVHKRLYSNNILHNVFVSGNNSKTWSFSTWVHVGSLFLLYFLRRSAVLLIPLLNKLRLQFNKTQNSSCTVELTIFLWNFVPHKKYLNRDVFNNTKVHCVSCKKYYY